ncbi:MAG: anaerobic ribonucleoside-triphosphate reductase activating protein [Bacilli bacterium]
MLVQLASSIQKDSIVDGLGIRSVIWFQGCSHNCKECHNPETHDMLGGYSVSLEDIYKEIDNLEFQDGITLSGGDPFYQVEAATKIAEYAHKKGLNVWSYTGFVYEDLIKNKDKYLKLLSNIDVLIDGPFMNNKKSFSCKFRGSTNQRIIDMNETLKKGVLVLHDEN